jgi:hypothetical protein
LNNAQTAPNGGWKAFENLRNRFWLIENLSNKSYNPIRESLYIYHREGLDVMAENPAKRKKSNPFCHSSTSENRQDKNKGLS